MRAQLFDRAHQRVQLSGEGTRLMQIADRMLALADEIDTTARDTPMRGLLRIGAVDTVAMICMTQFLSVLKQRYPDLRVELSVEVSVQLAARVRDREIDLAFLTDPNLGPQIESKPLGPVALAWITRSDLAIPRHVVEPRHLVDQQIITNPRPSQLYETTRSWFGPLHGDALHLCTCNSLALMAYYVKEGFGISILPPVVFAEDLQASRVRVLESEPSIPPRILHACYAKERDDRGMREAVSIMRDIVARTGVVGPS